MKKALSLVLCLMMLLGILPATASFAEEKEKLPTSVGESEILYLTEKKNTATLQEAQATEGVAIASIKATKADRIENAFYVIVDYAEMINNDVLLKKVKEMVASDKFVFIRANGQETNRDIISKLLGEEPAFSIEDSEIDALKAKYQTFGYLVFQDGIYGLQVVRHQMECLSFQDSSEWKISEEDWKTGTLTKESKKLVEEALSHIDPPSFFEEVEEAKFSVTMGINDRKEVDPSADSVSDVTDYTVWPYKKIIDSIPFKAKLNGEIMGRLRPCVYGKKIADAGSERLWVFLASVDMTNGKWGIWATRNKICEIELYSYHANPKNVASYKRRIEDFRPLTDTNGSTEETYTLGGTAGQSGYSASGSVSWKAKYKDVDFVPYPNMNSTYDTVYFKFVMQNKSTVRQSVRLVASILESNTAEGYYNGGRAHISLKLRPTWGYGFLGESEQCDIKTFSITANGK